MAFRWGRTFFIHLIDHEVNISFETWLIAGALMTKGRNKTETEWLISSEFTIAQKKWPHKHTARHYNISLEEDVTSSSIKGKWLSVRRLEWKTEMSMQSCSVMVLVTFQRGRWPSVLGSKSGKGIGDLLAELRLESSDNWPCIGCQSWLWTAMFAEGLGDISKRPEVLLRSSPNYEFPIIKKA